MKFSAEDFWGVKQDSTFRLGDRIKLTEKELCYYFRYSGPIPKGVKDIKGTVVSVDEFIGVEFDSPLKRGHDCHSCGKDGYCLYFNRDEVEKI